MEKFETATTLPALSTVAIFLFNDLTNSVNFLSPLKKATEFVKSLNQNIATVATKEGIHGAVISSHPGVTDPLIEEEVKKVLSTDLKNNLLELPKHFEVEIQYKRFNDAYNASFYPGCKLINSDTVLFTTDDYYEVVRALKFIL